MSREIKFRAWHKDHDEMIYTTDDIQYDKQSFSPFVFEVGFSYYPESDWEIMQFTGLKDSNGKEIYEGDIIKIESTGHIKKVFYHKCAFGIDLGNEVFAPIYWHNDVIVIGNIYQNPDLFK